jgi:hypothetical protein
MAYEPRATRGKNVTCGASGLIGSRFRGIDVTQAAVRWGKEMATILMIAVGPITTLNRSILRTERSMSGTDGDDFMCGHCGSIILEDFDPSTIRRNPVYQYEICENNNDLPFAVSDRRYWSSR